jgi:hypothetical protein
MDGEWWAFSICFYLPVLRFLFVEPDYFIGNSLLLFDNEFSKAIAAIMDR